MALWAVLRGGERRARQGEEEGPGGGGGHESPHGLLQEDQVEPRGAGGRRHAADAAAEIGRHVE